VACGIEQTNELALTQAWGLENRHAKSFPHTGFHATHVPQAARVDNLADAVIQEHFAPSSTGLELRAVDRAPAASRVASDPGLITPQDRAFIALQNAYRPHGGLLRLHGLSVEGVARSGGQEREVGHLFAARELFGFQWYGDVWIPMFQFALPGPTVAAGPQRVVAELGRDCDGWKLAGWFIQPNARLASQSPIECLDSRLADVLEAARVDRFSSSE
jgi:hypothetical protein